MMWYPAAIEDRKSPDKTRYILRRAHHDTQEPEQTRQPFNENHLRPCPMLENPELLREMVHRTGAHSTDLQSPETVDHLCDKCTSYAQCWKPEADRLWAAGETAKREKNK